MTTGQQLDNISTVSNVSALTHLLNPSGEGGGGVDHLVPFTDITCDLLEVILEGSLVTETFESDLEVSEIDAILTTSVYTADLVDTTMNGDLGCQL